MFDRELKIDCEIKNMNNVSYLQMKLVGRVDMANYHKLKESFSCYINSVSNFILDFRKLEHIDSTGIGFLVYMYKKVSDRNGKAILVCVKMGKIYKILEIIKLNNLFDIVWDMREAENKLTS